MQRHMSICFDFIFIAFLPACLCMRRHTLCGAHTHTTIKPVILWPCHCAYGLLKFIHFVTLFITSTWFRRAFPPISKPTLHLNHIHFSILYAVEYSSKDSAQNAMPHSKLGINYPCSSRTLCGHWMRKQSYGTKKKWKKRKEKGASVCAYC